MQVDTGAFQALTDQVAELATEVRQLKRDASWLRELEETRLERAGYISSPRTRSGRPRHLQVMDGGAS